MPTLPHCDELFLRYFDRWYDDDDRRRKGFDATRPDMLQADTLIGLTQAQAGPLTEKSQQDVLQHIEGMFDAAHQDWPIYLQVSGDFDLQWVDAWDRYYDTARIEDTIRNSDPTDFSNDYL